MESVTVIKHFDIVDLISSGFVPCSINDISDPFGFKGVKRTFHDDIVPAVVLSDHAANHTVLLLQSLVFVAGILSSTIGVMDYTLLGLSVPVNHRCGFFVYRGFQPIAHSPANYFM